MSVFDSHMHTPLCHHAKGMPREYAQRAIEVGLDGIIFTCHNPMPDGWFARVRMAPEDFEAYVDLIHETRDQFAGQLDVRLGLESDWYPGMENWLADLHDEAPFDFILGSVHYFGPEWQQSHFGKYQDDGDAEGYATEYFEQIAASAESGLFDSLAHPDLVKNQLDLGWDLVAFTPIIEDCLDRVAETGVAMELNTSGLHKRYPEFNPGPEFVAMMRERDIPITLGSDSHTPNRVGANFLDAIEEFELAGYSEIQVFEGREPEGVSLGKFRRRLA